MPAASASKPTYVLLPGASLGPWIWDRLTAHLDAKAVMLELPGRESEQARRGTTLRSAAEALAKQLDNIAGELVLCGHSIGGLLALQAVHGLGRRVRALVLVGSYVPPVGKPHLHMVPRPMRWVVRSALRMQRDGVKAPESALRKEYCNDLDEKDTQRVLKQARREPAAIFTDAIERSAAPARVPVTYVRLKRDNSVSPKLQAASIARVGPARVVDLDAGHLPMLSKPRELATIIKEASLPPKVVAATA